MIKIILIRPSLNRYGDLDGLLHIIYPENQSQHKGLKSKKKEKKTNQKVVSWPKSRRVKIQ